MIDPYGIGIYVVYDRGLSLWFIAPYLVYSRPLWIGIYLVYNRPLYIDPYVVHDRPLCIDPYHVSYRPLCHRPLYKSEQAPVTEYESQQSRPRC